MSVFEKVWETWRLDDRGIIGYCLIGSFISFTLFESYSLVGLHASLSLLIGVPPGGAVSGYLRSSFSEDTLEFVRDSLDPAVIGGIQGISFFMFTYIYRIILLSIGLGEIEKIATEAVKLFFSPGALFILIYAVIFGVIGGFIGGWISRDGVSLIPRKQS